MNNPKCAVCGHVSRVGAAACELCNTRFDAHGGAAAAGEPFVDYGEGVAAGALPTDIPSPRFLGVGDVVSPTLHVYRKHFVLVGKLVLATTLPLAFLQWLAYALVQSGDWAAGVRGPGTGGITLVAGGAVYWLLTVLGNAVLAGALAYAVVELQRRGAARAGDCLRWGLAKMFKVIAVTLLGALLIYGAPAVVLALTGVILGPLLFGSAAFGPVFFLVFALMLLPWIVLVLTVSLSVPAATVENRGVIDAFRRSAELTRGFKGLLFLTYFFWWVLIVGLNFVLKWSFSYGEEFSLAGLMVQTLVEGMLNSSTTVLTLYIFLGILNERRQAAAAFAQAPVV